MVDDRELMLTQGRHLFQRRELDGLDPAELARRCGLDGRTGQEIFPTREDLHFAVVEAELTAVSEQARVTMPEGDLGQRVKHLFRARIAFYDQHRIALRPLLKEVVFGENEWRARYETLLWRTSVQLVALVQEARRRGAVRVDVDETVVARALVAYFMTTVIMLLRDETLDATAAHGFMDPLVDTLVSSLA